MVTRPNLLPDFFILGAMRGGTASLHAYLQQHPALFLSEPRDPRFFDKHEFYWRGPDYYVEQFFAKSTDAAHRGEASATYLARPEIVAPRWWAVYGGRPIKAIVLLRNPVERAWSHYLYRRNHGYETGDFAAALAWDKAHPLYAHGFSPRYLRSGEYAALLATWQRLYPSIEFCCLLSEELARDPAAEVRRVLRFLEVDEEVPLDVSARLNQATQTHSTFAVRWLNRPPRWARTLAKRIWPEGWMRNEMRRRLRQRVQRKQTARPQVMDSVWAAQLRDYYRADVARLGDMLGRDLSHWPAPALDGEALNTGEKVIPGDVHHQVVADDLDHGAQQR